MSLSLSGERTSMHQSNTNFRPACKVAFENSSQMKTSSDDLWSQITAEDGEGDQPPPSSSRQTHQPTITVKYQRRKPDCPVNHAPRSRSSSSSFSSSSILTNESRPSLVPANNNKRVSWNRSLSTRGRLSISVTVHANCYPKPPRPTRKGKSAVPKGKVVQPPNLDKERAFFQEVDQFELMEESPSPKKFTWVVENQAEDVALPTVCTRLEKWLFAKRGNYMPSSSLSTILDTPGGNLLEPIPFESYSTTGNHTYPCKFSILDSAESLQPISNNLKLADIGEVDVGDFEASIRKLSLSEQSEQFQSDKSDPLYLLLQACGQSAPFSLSDVFSKLCEPEKIVKIGEGTYGEAFFAGDCVCKIVPIDGNLKVNGEVQKRSDELLEEVVLSLTLNQLKADESDRENATTGFIETKALRVCEGLYDPALLKAWEAWDAMHGSENDHPEQFPPKQHYAVFVLQHGGTDLENFVLLDFDEAKSLLVQVTAALAVAEAAYEFEHRDLHWGNILLSRIEIPTIQCTLEGKKLFMKSSGISISIIDFTLSRINTGNNILYLDLSSDPELFEGPKGDKQADTYRKMRDLTDECWEGSFPKTNVFWLQYLVDILLLKKSFKRTGKEERDLRSFKKRMNHYNSAKETITDSFFSNVLSDHPI